MRPPTVRRLPACAFAASLALAISGCGGGGGSGGGDDGHSLSLSITYALEGFRPELYAPVAIDPVVSGLEGHAPHCELASGVIPPGLVLGPNCHVSGAATALGNYQANVAVTVDGFGDRATSLLLIAISRPTLSSPFDYTPYLAAGQAVSGKPSVQLGGFTLDSTRTATFELGAGALPHGLSLDPATGHLVGTPVELGSFSIDVTALVAQGAQSYRTAPLTVAIAVGYPTLSLQYPSCCSTAVGSSFEVLPASSYVPIEGSSTFYELGQGALPSGLALDSSTGRIFGVPTVVAVPVGTPVSVRQTVSLPDGSTATQSVDLPFSIHGLEVHYPSSFVYVQDGIPFASELPIASFGLPGDAYSYTMRLLPGSAYSGNVAEGALPSWVQIDPRTGRISGTAPSRTVRLQYQFEMEVTTVRNGSVYLSTTAFELD